MTSAARTSYDWESQLADYTGKLTFAASTSYASTVTIPLFIKSHPVPVRNPKIVEIATLPSQLDAGTWEVSQAALFYGASDPLVLELSGWMITPTTKSGADTILAPTADGSASGTSMGSSFYHWSYGDLICAYMEGRMNPTTNGNVWSKQDPLYYTDPYGRRYSKPTIMAFDFSHVKPVKKQNFSLTLWLDKGI